MIVSRCRARRSLFSFAAVVFSAQLATAQLQWENKDTKTSFRFGLLSQLMAESVDLPGTDDDADNIFLRRFRLIGEFKLPEDITVFIQTDSPNLGKGAPSGTKDAGDIFLQDVVATWKYRQEFQLDGGLLLTEQTYNHNQSAASLLAVDYGAFTFDESGPIGSRVGRDEGLRARGYLFDDMLEYRAGIYQGQRGTNASNEFRYMGRLMVHLLGPPQTGLTYRGSSLGKSKALAFGASYDKQQDYDSYGTDVFFEHPFGNGNGIVAQLDYVRLDGGSFLTTLTERSNVLFEGGVYLSEPKLQPFVQIAARDIDGGSDEHRYGFGIGWYPGGYGNNLKLAYTHIDGGSGFKGDQINLQWQVFTF